MHTASYRGPQFSETARPYTLRLGSPVITFTSYSGLTTGSNLHSVHLIVYTSAAHISQRIRTLVRSPFYISSKNDEQPTQSGNNEMTSGIIFNSFFNLIYLMFTNLSVHLNADRLSQDL